MLWWIEALFGTHHIMKSLSGQIMTLGKGIFNFKRQRIVPEAQPRWNMLGFMT